MYYIEDRSQIKNKANPSKGLWERWSRMVGIGLHQSLSSPSCSRNDHSWLETLFSNTLEATDMVIAWGSGRNFDIFP